MKCGSALKPPKWDSTLPRKAWSAASPTGANTFLFQRSAERSAEDPGVHLEYSDQLNGDYGCVAACRLSARMLSVDLSRQLGALVGVEGLDVALSVSAESFETLKSGLGQVFRGISGMFHVA